MDGGDAIAAEACFRDAIHRAPDFAEAHANLALLLDRGGQVVEAESHYRHAIALNDGLVRVHLNLGALLAGSKRFEEAEAAYRRVLTLDPGHPGAWSNLGALLACVKREQEAEDCYRQALALVPDHVNARFNLAYLLLRQGRYPEGWVCLESRDWYGSLAEHFPCPRWQGEPVAGKSLLIGLEAGHGDMIQFCRYAALLKEQGAVRVDVVCHPGLKLLLQTLDGVDDAISVSEELPVRHWDYWVPPLSLPLRCDTRLDTIPAHLPYLAADTRRMAHWAPLLPQQGLRVGLVWKGNPRFENDIDRSLPGLDTLAPLGSVAGVRFVSLQKGAGEQEAAVPPPGLNLTDLGALIDDFSDTAAIVAQLDLVICVDTAVGHLAGALGKPVWVLLPWYKTDWRWLATGESSPWYPGVMRLFRQDAMGDWEPVVERVAGELARFRNLVP
ncbi:MAG: tetratricopeptide repeat protein [Rhodocyclaceae bacterium]|nr:tetratricopeptide repeat protein [Rhodocyclaceae bacterium]